MNRYFSPHSLRFRLLAGTLVWIVLSIVVAGWGLERLFHQHVLAQYQAELRVHLDQLTALLAVDAQGRPAPLPALSDPRFSRPHSGLYWQVDAQAQGAATSAGDEAGVLRSRSLWDFVLTAPADVQADGEIHRHRIDGPTGKPLLLIERTITVDEVPGRFRLLVAGDQAVIDDTVARLNGVLWLALGALGAGLLVAALLQVGIGLAPLRHLQGALAKVRRGEAMQLEGRFPEEIMPLAGEFNTVLSENGRALERARTQAGNLAHALKTPLTVMANAASASAGDLAELVGEQVSVARRQIDYHLARAQAAAIRRQGLRTPVKPVVAGLIRTMERLHAERRLIFTLQPVDEAAVFAGDVQDLQEMLGNLLDNACKWAKEGIEVAVTCDDGQVFLRIDDDGPGLPEAARSLVLGRGVRADERVPGNGLGLSIVEDIVALYGGQLRLGPSPSGGLRAVLILPGAAA